ncbi:MAG: prepilin-type N-terminal cleavage/methylation domain-containing protein [Candidatus Omnitrophica bacterium]|nr:prepilin-type N-terminal cleavage/methylation domain-containing protein [Candidatus Omnitrophota bacterium]
MKRAGFTLVEIMIVVGVIALLAALAIPNLMRSRLNANEAVAQGTLKTVSSACENFRAAQTPPTYPANLAALVNATPSYIPDAIDTATTGAPKNGYNITYTLISTQRYVCCATPAQVNVTGIRTFAINESGMLRATNNNGAVVTTAVAYEAMTVMQ